MNRIFLDCEFIEDGSTIDLISIALVAESGDEYYAVSSEFSMIGMAASPWLMEHVWRSLPKIHGDARMYALARAGWCPKWLRRRLPGLDLALRARSLSRIVNWDHPDVKSRAQIADEVRQFILSYPEPQLWADYGAYDHVVLCQLFGAMVDLPAGMPMFTCDLQQEAARLNVADADLPQQEAGQHNALADARHNREVFRFLAQRERQLHPLLSVDSETGIVTIATEEPMTILDPKTVREIAREYILDCGQNADDIGAYVGGHHGPGLTKHEFGAWCSAVRADLRSAVPTWPDEQPLCSARHAGGTHRCLLEPGHGGTHAVRIDEGMIEWEDEQAQDGRDACPHCPDGHKRADRQPWSAWVADVRDGDGQPTTIRVARSNGAHVAESDAQWIRERLNDRTGSEQAERDAGVRAVARLLRELRAYPNVNALKAVTRVEEHFAEPIAALDARTTDGGTP